MTTADGIQQQLEHRKRPATSKPFAWDMQRTARLTGFYGGLQMPFVHFWFAGLERVFGAVTPTSNPLRFAAKVATDQSIGLPAVLAAFCVVQPYLQGQGLSGGVEKLKRDWSTMVVRGWMVWVPTICATFAFVPLPYRPLTINFVSLGWSTYVSSMNE